MAKLTRTQINRIKDFFIDVCGARSVRMSNGGAVWKLTYNSEEMYYHEGRPHWGVLDDGYGELHDTTEDDILGQMVWEENTVVFEKEDNNEITSVYHVVVNGYTLRAILDYVKNYL